MIWVSPSSRSRGRVLRLWSFIRRVPVASSPRRRQGKNHVVVFVASHFPASCFQSGRSRVRPVLPPIVLWSRFGAVLCSASGAVLYKLKPRVSKMMHNVLFSSGEEIINNNHAITSFNSSSCNRHFSLTLP